MVNKEDALIGLGLGVLWLVPLYFNPQTQPLERYAWEEMRVLGAGAAVGYYIGRNREREYEEEEEED